MPDDEKPPYEKPEAVPLSDDSLDGVVGGAVDLNTRCFSGSDGAWLM